MSAGSPPSLRSDYLRLCVSRTAFRATIVGKRAVCAWLPIVSHRRITTMIFSVSDKVRAKCLEYDVDISPDAHFIEADGSALAVEAPAMIRPGLFDIDLVGGFTYMGDAQISRGSYWRRTNFVGRF